MTGTLRGVNFCPFITQNLSKVTWVLQWLIVDCLQHAMLIPVLVCHLRFHRSCDVLEKVIDYKFKNRFLLQLALTHPSYRWGSAGRHLSVCPLSINVVLVSDIWRWMGARETSKLQRGWYWVLNTEHVTCFAAVMFRHWHIISTFLYFSTLCPLLYLFFCSPLLISVLTCFIRPLLAYFVPSLLFLFFLCLLCLWLVFPLLCLFYSSPFSVPPILFFFYLFNFFSSLIIIGFLFSLCFFTFIWSIFTFSFSLSFFQHSFFFSIFLYHFLSPPTSLCLVQFVAVSEMLLLACLM